MRLFYRGAPLVFAAHAAAQQSNFFSSLLSDATSIYGQVTSMLGDTSTGNSASTTQTSSNDSSSASASSSPDSSSTSARSSQSSTPSASSSDQSSITSASSGASATATPSSTSASSTASSASDAAGGSAHSSDHSNRNLGIILGCVLGALLLALLVLLFLCCRRRRRRRYHSSGESRSTSSNEKGWIAGRRTRSRSRSPDEFHSYTRSWDNPTKAPKTFESSHGFAHSRGEHNPFIPITSAPRRKPVPTYTETQNSGHTASQPFRNGLSSNPTHAYEPLPHDSHHGGALVAGAGGLALGGAAAHAAHRHDEKHDHVVTSDEIPTRRYSERDDNMLPEAVVPSSTTIGENGTEASKGGFNVIDARRPRSTESSRARRKSWSRSREYVAGPEEEWENVPLQSSPPPLPQPSALPAAVAGPGTTTTTTTVLRHSRPNSKSPHRNGLRMHTTSNFTSPSPGLNPYDDTPHVQAEAAQFPQSRGRDVATRPSDGYEIPPTPPLRERRESPLGSAAPAAAAASYHNGRSPSHSHRYSISSPTSQTPPVPPVPVPTDMPLQDIRRHSLPSSGRKSLPGTSRDEIPHLPQSNPYNQQNSPLSGTVSPPFEPYRAGATDTLMSPVSPVTNSQPGTWTMADAAHLRASDPFASSAGTSRGTSGFASPLSGDLSSNRPSRPSSMTRDPSPQVLDAVGSGNKPIVGDNGYPHHNIPRRMSGGEYDYAETGPLGPQTVSSRPASLTGSQERGDRDVSSGDDSAFRISSGMPGAWGDPSLPRRSGDMARYPPRAYSNTPRSTRGRSSSRNSRHSSPASLPRSARPISRPGYGVGSGDPFDLAAMRMDSNMTEYSAIGSGRYYAQPPKPRSRSTSTPARHEHVHQETASQRYERVDSDFDHDLGPQRFDVGRAY